MEISGLSTSLSTSGSFSSTARAELRPTEDSKSVDEARHHHGRRGRGHHGRALGIFKQEMRLALKAHFHAKFATAQQNYAAVQEPVTSDDVAEEALGAAKQLVAESPTTAAKSLISFRAKVHETASYVRETVGAPDEVEDVDNAVAKVDEGLDALGDEVAGNRESSASVLDIDSRTRQRSTIRIRTQEGDVVKLSLKRMDSLSATDVAASTGGISATSTEVEVSSRSRLMLRVEGDLNESEFAAIQNVFAQAEQIADEFFGGDIGAAFNLAAGFEFDTEQLARVNMRFRMRQMSSVSYAESVRSAPLESVSAPAVAAPDSTSAPAIEAQPASDVSETSTAPVNAPAELEAAAEPVDTEVAENSPTETSALAGFFDALSAFLRSVGEGFSAERGSGSFTYHYSESFKLSLLKAVIHTVAPEESDEAAANASTLIDEVSE